MFIGNEMNSILALQRSAMFPGKRQDTALCFAPLERGEIFGRPAFDKHLAPNGAKANNVLLHFQVESAKDKCEMIYGEST